MVQHRVGLGELVARALAGNDVQELWPLEHLHVPQRGNEGTEIVAVDRPDVVESQLLEQRARRHHALDVFLGALRQLAQNALAGALRGGVETPRHQLGKVLVQGAHRRRDGHFVVIENHEQIHIHRAHVVQRFERHAGRHRAVTDYGHHVALYARKL